MTTWLHLTFTQKSLLFGKLTIIENISFLNYVCASNAGATRVKCTHQNQNTSPPVLQLETPEFPDNHRQLCCPHRQAACSGWWGWSLGARGCSRPGVTTGEGWILVPSLLEATSGQVSAPAWASDVSSPFPQDQKNQRESGSCPKPFQCLQDRTITKISRQPCEPNTWLLGVTPGVAVCSACVSPDSCPDRGHHRRSAEP